MTNPVSLYLRLRKGERRFKTNPEVLSQCAHLHFNLNRYHCHMQIVAVYEVDVISGSDYLAVGKKNVTKMETK